MTYKNILLSLLTVAMAACSNAEKRTDSAEAEKFATDFDKASRALEEKNYPLAAQLFDQLRASKPTSEGDFISLFNAGVAYENMKDCQQAAIRYRQVVQGSFKKYPRLQALAQYNLSSVYECLGDDTKALAALLESRKLKSHLPIQITLTEMPARLAAFYAELGDRKTAMKYFDEASQGLKRLGAESADSKKFAQKIGQILFLMGRLSDRDLAVQTNPSNSLRAIEFQQPFLLQAVEMEAEPWARDAKDQLVTAYRNVSRWMYKPNYEGAGIIQEALIQLRALKGLRFPKESAKANEMFEELDVEEKKWMSFLAKAAEVNKLTSESQKREGIKRQYKAKPIKENKQRK